LRLEGNDLRVLNASLLIPLKSIKILSLHNNSFVCGCELRLTLLRCEEKQLNKGATCRKEKSGDIMQWTELKSFNSCQRNQLADMSSSIGTNLKGSDDTLLPADFFHLLLLVIVIFVVLQLLCCSVLTVLYCKTFRSSGSLGGEKSVHFNESAGHDCQYEYIKSPDNYSLPELPPRQKQITSCEQANQLQINWSVQSEKFDFVQLAVSHNEGFGEHTSCGTYKSHDYYDERHQEIAYNDKKSHHTDDGTTPEEASSFPGRENDTNLEIPLRRKSDYDVGLTECKDRQKSTVSSGRITNGSSSSVLMEENYVLYSEALTA
jgi:hypothetical protein